MDLKEQRPCLTSLAFCRPSSKATPFDNAGSFMEKRPGAAFVPTAAQEPITEQPGKASALSGIAPTLAEAGEIKQALEMTQKFDAYFKTHVLGEIASTLAKAGDGKQAVELAQQIEERPGC